ncbi:22795_t:CDS:2 [Dentiscutata erythropus]|uniref:22795_t:CDS:1 n=1 Tax=Dentiscutata erythropus TaxID=1348616 RepID=A0A9N9G8I4_9GLOM|nr:22795_t:CDS:2 [Dentiscutata erythropus]
MSISIIESSVFLIVVRFPWAVPIKDTFSGHLLESEALVI